MKTNMNGILPTYFRPIGYALMILSVLVPILLFVTGYIDDSNLLFIKTCVKLLVWIALFMVFLAKVKDESEATAKARVKAIYRAIYLLGFYYVIVLLKGYFEGNIEKADASVAIIYMAFNVACLEYGIQKQRIDRIFKK